MTDTVLTPSPEIAASCPKGKIMISPLGYGSGIDSGNTPPPPADHILDDLGSGGTAGNTIADDQGSGGAVNNEITPS